MEKSYQWEQTAEATCPYCGETSIYYGACDAGDIVRCDDCNIKFQLGVIGG